MFLTTQFKLDASAKNYP